MVATTVQASITTFATSLSLGYQKVHVENEIDLGGGLE